MFVTFILYFRMILEYNIYILLEYLCREDKSVCVLYIWTKQLIKGTYQSVMNELWWVFPKYNCTIHVSEKFLSDSMKESWLTVKSPRFFNCPIPGSYNMKILSLWVFTSLPCSDSKSHSLQEKKFVNFMLQVDKISHIINICGLQFTIITVYIMITHEPSFPVNLLPDLDSFLLLHPDSLYMASPSAAAR